MKILFVDDMLWGHHIPYLKALADSHFYESVVLIPEKVPGLAAEQIVCEKLSFDTKKISDYMECINFSENQAQKKKADIIHFLNGDKIMRYFGLGMGRLSRNWSVVITFHHFFSGFLRKISYQMMSVHRMVVVHTDCFYIKMKHYHIGGVSQIEYPGFLQKKKPNMKHSEIPMIGMYGATRYEKGVDILLEALKKVKAPFRLRIAGMEGDFLQPEIEKMCASYKDKVFLDMRFLTEEELEDYWNHTDLVVLPYRINFDGASGQLTEGVSRGLPIIGPSHGSLGDMIQRNHLGRVFQTENVDDLAKVIEEVLKSGFSYDDVAKEYQKRIGPERFCEKYYDLYRKVNVGNTKLT